MKKLNFNTEFKNIDGTIWLEKNKPIFIRDYLVQLLGQSETKNLGALKGFEILKRLSSQDFLELDTQDFNNFKKDVEALPIITLIKGQILKILEEC